MSKKILLFLVLILIFTGIGYSFLKPSNETVQTTAITNYILNPRNCTYIIDGKNITLMNGHSEEEMTAGSASKLITQYFGNEISGDFNNDGFSDTAFLLTQNLGSSGTYYYIAVALGSQNKCIGTNAILLGDRIAPQTTEFQNGNIVVNYAIRKPAEPMTERPSIGTSKYMKVIDGRLTETEK